MSHWLMNVSHCVRKVSDDVGKVSGYVDIVSDGVKKCQIVCVRKV